VLELNFAEQIASKKLIRDRGVGPFLFCGDAISPPPPAVLDLSAVGVRSANLLPWRFLPSGNICRISNPSTIVQG